MSIRFKSSEQSTEMRERVNFSMLVNIKKFKFTSGFPDQSCGKMRN